MSRPSCCSGLPVARYGPSELAAQLGGGWALIVNAREEHITPVGVAQPFTWRHSGAGPRMTRTAAAAISTGSPADSCTAGRARG
jgi:hypothetical protein